MKRIALILGISLLGLYAIGFIVVPPGRSRVVLYSFGQDRVEALNRYSAYALMGDECESIKIDSEYKACWARSFDKAHTRVLNNLNATQGSSL